MQDVVEDQALIVHSRAEVDQVTSTERGNFKVRNFDINYDAPQDEAALFKAVGEWIADMRKQHSWAFSVESIVGGTFRVTVVYQVRPPREDREALAAPLTVVPDAA